jgi:hypothetical protein
MTHLVTTAVKRSAKALAAIPKVHFMVSEEWILESVKAKRILCTHAPWAESSLLITMFTRSGRRLFNTGHRQQVRWSHWRRDPPTKRHFQAARDLCPTPVLHHAGHHKRRQERADYVAQRRPGEWWQGARLPPCSQSPRAKRFVS